MFLVFCNACCMFHTRARTFRDVKRLRNEHQFHLFQKFQNGFEITSERFFQFHSLKRFILQVFMLSHLKVLSSKTVGSFVLQRLFRVL